MSKKSSKPQRESRHKERELAFQALYGMSFSNINDLDALKKSYLAFPREDDFPLHEKELQGFTWNLVRGVWDNEKNLDRDIKKYSHNWRIERMGKVELLLLRMSLYELFSIGTPDKVVISEYLALAEQFGVDTAKSFINGILDSAAKELYTNSN